MKIAVKNNLVVLAREDFILDNKGRYNHNISLTPDTCEIYGNITLPENFRAGCFTYIDGVFEATPELQARLDAEQAQQEQELLEQKQALLDSIEPLQQRVFIKNSDVWAIKSWQAELQNKSNKNVIKQQAKLVADWCDEVRLQDNGITIDNTLEEIQARIDRINELDEIFPEIEVE